MCSSFQGSRAGGAAERPGNSSRAKSARGVETSPRRLQQDGTRHEHTDGAAQHQVRRSPRTNVFIISKLTLYMKIVSCISE